MADPLSLAAAAAGFVGLAGQLAQGVIKLKEICTTIKDAPKDVADLCTKMESLQGVLEEVGDQIQQLSHGNIKIDTGIFHDVMAQCEASRYRVEAHLKRFGESFRSNRAAAVRFVFKKKEIQEMLSNVETCKSSLIIARQSIDGAISSFRHETLLQKHTELSSDNSQLLQQASRVETIVEAVSSQQRLDFETISQQVAKSSERSIHGYRSLQDAHRESSSKISESLRDLKHQLHSHHDDGSSKIMLTQIEGIQRNIHASNRHLEQLVSRRSDVSHLNSARTTKRVKVGFQSLLFNFSVEFSSETESQDPKGSVVARNKFTKNVCTIRLPNWFVQDQYSLAITRSKNGWMFHPSVYRTVDRDSRFFEACEHGDLEGMKRLLATKQAYLGDRSVSSYWTSGPESGLSLALFYKQFEACELLVNAGILSFFQSPDYTEVLASLAYILRSERHEARKFLRLIESNQNLEPDWDGDIELGSDYHRVIQDLRHCAEETGASALDRFEARMFPAALDPSSMHLEIEVDWMSEFLGHADHVQQIRATAPHSIWLLFVLASNISKLFWDHANGSPPKKAVWACSFALAVLCDTELDLHADVGILPEDWSRALFSANWIGLKFAYTTPFSFIFATWFTEYGFTEQSFRHLEALNGAVRLWVNTLHVAGVDLAAYAEIEVWTIDRILMKVSANYDVTCRLLHGPQPGDWRFENGRLGEACPAYFWRGIEATPISEDLATKVLDLMHRVEHPEAVHCDVPGGWESDWDDSDDIDWIIKGWLAFLEDSQLAQMEADLERLDPKGFYEMWDLNSVVEYWSYDEDDSVSSEASLDES